MIHSTKGIVLRTVAYSETSIIAQLYTELFGLQSYLINGVRSGKKSALKSNLFQPASILELEVYYNEQKNLQRIREARWHYLYKQIFFNISKNTVALFITELLQKVIRQPEQNPSLYNFIEDAYMHLDNADARITAGYPLFFALHLTSFLGFHINDDYGPDKPLFDLREGEFIKEPPLHPYYIDRDTSAGISALLKIRLPEELHQIQLSGEKRRSLLEYIIQFYRLHVQDFGSMKSLPILREILA